MGGMCRFSDCPWGGAARVVGARKKSPTAAASEPPSLRELPPLWALDALVPPLWAHCVPVSLASPRLKPRSLESHCCWTPSPYWPSVSWLETRREKIGRNLVALGGIG